MGEKKDGWSTGQKVAVTGLAVVAGGLVADMDRVVVDAFRDQVEMPQISSTEKAGPQWASNGEQCVPVESTERQIEGQMSGDAPDPAWERHRV